jgi:hypothetical protein
MRSLLPSSSISYSLAVAACEPISLTNSCSQSLKAAVAVATSSLAILLEHEAGEGACLVALSKAVSREHRSSRGVHWQVASWVMQQIQPRQTFMQWRWCQLCAFGGKDVTVQLLAYMAKIDSWESEWETVVRVAELMVSSDSLLLLQFVAEAVAGGNAQQPMYGAGRLLSTLWGLAGVRAAQRAVRDGCIKTLQLALNAGAQLSTQLISLAAEQADLAPLRLLLAQQHLPQPDVHRVLLSCHRVSFFGPGEDWSIYLQDCSRSAEFCPVWQVIRKVGSQFELDSQGIQRSSAASSMNDLAGGGGAGCTGA